MFGKGGRHPQGGGGVHTEQTGKVVGNFELKPLIKETNFGGP